MKNISVLIVISLFLICASAVFATPAEQDLLIPDSSPAGAETGASFGAWDFFRTILVLALVIAAVYGVLHLLKKMHPRFIQTDDKRIKVEATKVLAPGKTVHIIEVEGRRFLVGSADHSVGLLAELDRKEQEQ
ncbi:MAG: FliO/MopB family protein [Spirochaetia bacterium]|nr:FliO/MopB family protein [Spirochaetia bacterium]MBQ3713874.1 FliO/MopB family protein [Spirochaetia bacterium]MBQ6673352.1 FliO/MopB family protein [Spirochaetia bacterium]